MQRVHVIGGPGSGKTTLARRLSARLGAEAFDLDEVAYVGGAGAERSPADRRVSLEAILAKPAWVTAGKYVSWIDGLLESADAIVWLDVSWRIAAWRIVVRHVRASLAGTNRHPGWLLLLRFLRSTRRYYLDAAAVEEAEGVTRARTVRQLERYADKVVRCLSTRDVRLFLERARL